MEITRRDRTGRPRRRHMRRIQKEHLQNTKQTHGLGDEEYKILFNALQLFWALLMATFVTQYYVSKLKIDISVYKSAFIIDPATVLLTIVKFFTIFFIPILALVYAKSLRDKIEIMIIYTLGAIAAISYYIDRISGYISLTYTTVTLLFFFLLFYYLLRKLIRYVRL